MDLVSCTVNWKAPATLKDVEEPHRTAMWVGDHLYAGDLAGAVRKFRTMPVHKQQHLEMIIESGAIESTKATIIDSKSLKALSQRTDVPNA